MFISFLRVKTWQTPLKWTTFDHTVLFKVSFLNLNLLVQILRDLRSDVRNRLRLQSQQLIFLFTHFKYFSRGGRSIPKWGCFSIFLVLRTWFLNVCCTCTTASDLKIRALMLDQLQREPYFSGTHIQSTAPNLMTFGSLGSVQYNWSLQKKWSSKTQWLARYAN